MERDVGFTVGEENLRGSLFVPQEKGSFASVIFFHGSGGNGETYFKAAKKLAENGILALAFNYRGCGRSDGKFEDQTIAMGIEDAKAALNFFLSQKGVDKSRIGFCGGSFGGFIASLLAVRFNPKSLVLISPAAYPPPILNRQRDYNDVRSDFTDSKSYKNIAKFKGDLLVVKCELEDVLPVGILEEYTEVAQNAKRKEEFILKGAKHQVSINPTAQAVLIEKIKDWFLETLQ